MLVKDSLSDELYDASVAGSSWDYETHDLGGSIVLSGYSDTITTLLERILRAMRNMVVDPIRFQVMSEEVCCRRVSACGFSSCEFTQLQRSMDTFYLTDPERIAASYLRFLTERHDLSEPAELFRDVVSCELQSRFRRRRWADCWRI